MHPINIRILSTSVNDMSATTKTPCEQKELQLHLSQEEEAVRNRLGIPTVAERQRIEQKRKEEGADGEKKGVRTLYQSTQVSELDHN